MKRIVLLLALAWAALPPAGAQQVAAPCQNGTAVLDGVTYSCRDIDLLAVLPHSVFSSPGTTAPPTLQGVRSNEVWGWTDPQTGREYALMGLTDGTAFIDVTVPAAPVYLGKLPAATNPSLWRTLRVYRDHVFVGSEALGHGVQVFDLRRLRGLTGNPVETFTADARYTGAGKTHTLFINEQTGFLYLAGANQAGFQCRGGGLHIVDVRDPRNPQFAGCYDANAYTHETHCEVYAGPDARYAGREICVQYQGAFTRQNNHVAFVDVTDKANPVLISRVTYPDPGYTHQGWFTEDRRFLFVNDELDDSRHPARTVVIDVQDLELPQFVGHYQAPVAATDHNLYIVGRYMYQSNYESGVRIVDVGGMPDLASVREVAHFDTHPQSNTIEMNGNWHLYPYFASGTLVANDMQNGLFLLRFNDALRSDAEPPPAGGAVLSPGEPNPFTGATTLTLRVSEAQRVRAEVFDMSGRRVAVLYDGDASPGAAQRLTFEAGALPAGVYVVRVQGETFTASQRVTLSR
ncbi:MAG: choice-of-anchor B family protein [Rubricoccaceae bacterium]